MACDERNFRRAGRRAVRRGRNGDRLTAIRLDNQGASDSLMAECNKASEQIGRYGEDW